MDKSNRPTYSQIQALYWWMSWQMPRNEAVAALDWLEAHATRREVSAEIQRIGNLHHSHKLDKAECFNSKVWEKYEG